ncbi:MAG TPA: AGE family epimerase/isomerase, partial [Longimicrobiales bacterium]
FLSQFDSAFTPTGDQQKMIVTQSRHVWTNARAAAFFRDSSYLPAARWGVAFLRDHMWDRQKGGFYWLVARDGTPVPERDGRLIKQAYGEAFGIYALATYYEVTRDTAALRLAQDAFRWLDAHAHDPVHAGYFNYMERDGTALRDGYAGTPPKDQNSSIHLLEALTQLYGVWPDTVVRHRLAEMLHLVRDVIREDPGTLRLFSTADWTPISYRDSSDAVRQKQHYFDHVSFGHDVETAYLMLEASEALGLAHDTATLRASKQMVDHALGGGWDRLAGGFYDEGYYLKDRPGLTVTLHTKNWWAQAEGLNTLLMMAQLYPADSMHYQQKFLRQWNYVNTYLIDHVHGGWYEGGLDMEPERRGGNKGHIWKATYHESRAMMNVIRRLESGTS